MLTYGMHCLDLANQDKPVHLDGWLRQIDELRRAVSS